VLIPQVSHSWLAWQLAEHWGNRRFARPAPRAEVLAAVLLHDCGWTEFDSDPGIDATGRPRAFDRMPVQEHLEVWRASVSRAALYCRYAALLVATHFASLAEVKTRDLLDLGDTEAARRVQVFGAEMMRRRGAWREALANDARFQPYIDGTGWQVNTSLLVACDRVAVFLCASLPSPWTAETATSSGETETLEFTQIDNRAWRVRPWPFQGDRVRLQCEGRRVSRLEFSSGEELRKVLQQSPVDRLSFALVRPSAK